MSSSVADPLIARLAGALPAESQFSVHHVSAPPANCAALFSAPPNEEPEPTECESHFLSISIDHEEALVQAFAVEVLIYTTATLTTIFVSKADSTGYLPLTRLPKSTTSPIKAVTSAFLEHLIETKRRKDARLVLSLFARAQDQYLFPGSIENSNKHVLDDRGLIKWWCKIFDSILAKYPSAQSDSPSSPSSPSNTSPLARGYLVVPGCDSREIQAYFPRPYNKSRWLATDPLRLLGKSLTLPERCLIPRFPDDPKARFALDLDDELPENGPQPMNSPEKNPHPGKWKSVRSLEQFWELMAFRQECAAGRLVGFLWGVFESGELRERPDEAQLENVEGALRENMVVNGADTAGALPTPQPSQLNTQYTDTSRLPPTQDIPSIPLLSPQTSQQLQAPDSPTPLPATLEIPALDDKVTPEPPTSPQRQPDPTPAERGSIRLSPPAYTRVIDSLMELDYADLALAKESAVKFEAKVIEEANKEDAQTNGGFGVRLTGTKKIEAEEKVEVKGVESGKESNGAESNGVASDGVPMLGAGLVRKKRSATEVDQGEQESVNVLSVGLVRKKPKIRKSG